MKIGIIVYSNTGNTLSVAEKLKKNLVKKGNIVNIEKINIDGNKKITNNPDISKYTYIIFASFVEAFHLNPIMNKYLKQLDEIENKKVSAFITQGFSKSWLGGNKAIKQIKKICNNKNFIFDKSGIINWGSKNREKQIEQLIIDFSRT
ncbi:MAG: flavodoxin family protein [Bacilli bacterium]|nr:flavodoxin family protein [Bacilli bacterium]